MQHYGGVSRSLCNTIYYLPQDINLAIGVSHCNNVHLRDLFLVPDIQPAKVDWLTSRARFYFKGKRTLFNWASNAGLIPSAERYNRKLSITLLKEQRFDVFHPTFFDDYFLRYLKSKPFVLTVHDMMPEIFPEYFKAKDQQIVNKRKLVRMASAITVPSENTKNDLCSLLNVPEKNITVIPWGGPEKRVVSGSAPVQGCYFLYVGSRDAYKNFIGLLNDFSVFHTRYPEVLLVCVGSSFNLLEDEAIKSRGLTEVVKHCFASDDELARLYANALAFIFPSRYEGFGLPILESFAYGCPLLLNNRSCFPEIAGDAALYFISDGDTSELPYLMEQVLNWTPDERQAQIEKGYQRLSQFSWRKAAEQYAEVYRSLVYSGL